MDQNANRRRAIELEYSMYLIRCRDVLHSDRRVDNLVDGRAKAFPCSRSEPLDATTNYKRPDEWGLESQDLEISMCISRIGDRELGFAMWMEIWRLRTPGSRR